MERQAQELEQAARRIKALEANQLMYRNSLEKAKEKLERLDPKRPRADAKREEAMQQTINKLT